MRFPPILALLTAAGVAGFQEALRDEYPIFQPEGGADIELGPGGFAVSEKTPIWRMRDDGQTWRVSIAADMVALEALSYTSIEDFASRLDGVLDALRRTMYPKAATRVGLRKVNDIQGMDVTRPQLWSRWLRSDLLGLVGADDLGADIALAFSEMRLTDGNETLAIRHGVLPDALDKYRLDLDYFSSEELPIQAGGELVQAVRKYAAATTAFFHWCLTRELYDWLGPRPREEVDRAGRSA